MEKMFNKPNYSEHTEKYLEAYGIKKNSSETGYVYNGEIISVWPQINGVNFYSEKDKKIMAEVCFNGDIFLGGNSISDNALCINFKKINDRCYTLNLYERDKYGTSVSSFENGACSIAVSIDEIGNVSIYSCGIAGVTIKNEQAVGNANYYLNLVKEQLKGTIPDNNWALIELMFSDPRLLKVLSELMDTMMPRSSNKIYTIKQRIIKKK